MEQTFIGEAIKRRRMELGLTQKQLCAGICEPITISRLENGKQMPTRSRLRAILERLDMPTDRYPALLSQNEVDIDSLQREIAAYNVRFSQSCGAEKEEVRRKALAAHQQLLSITDGDDRIARQMILRSQVILGKEDGPYTTDEQKELLTQAICLTCPSFDLNAIQRGLYTTDEIKVINQLALVHVYAGELDSAVSIYAQLYPYIKQHFQNIPSTKAHMTMVAFNYASCLDGLGLYCKAIEIAQEGRRACLDHGHYLSLPGLLEVMAECYYHLGEKEQSRDLYYQAYYLCKAIDDRRNLAVIREEAHSYLGIVFPA